MLRPLLAVSLAGSFAAPSAAIVQPFAPRQSVTSITTGDGSEGFFLEAEGAVDQLGERIAVGGDLNDDGFDDLVVAAPQEFLNRGSVYVIFGGADVADGTSRIDVGGLDGTDGFTIRGLATGDDLGSALAITGDVNGDGIDDLAIGASGVDRDIANEGAVYVVFGRPDLGSGGAIDLASLDGTNGFVARGILRNDRTGTDVDLGGDVNGDGDGDLVIGALQCSASSEPLPGEAYVLFGGPGIGGTGEIDLATLAGGGGTDGFLVRGAVSCDFLGESVAFPGDLDDDGFDDLALGAPSVDRDGLSFRGAAYVLWGGPDVAGDGVIELARLTLDRGLVIPGPDDFDQLGSDLAAAGDLNDDGRADLAIGASGAEPLDPDAFVPGAVHVLFGSPDLRGTAEIDVASFDGTDGVTLGSTIEEDTAGSSVAGGGDVNGDGIDDVVIGAPGNNVVEDSPGRAYVVFGGSDFGAGGLRSLAALDGTNGFRLTGAEPEDRHGFAVGLGDVTGDGIADVATGALAVESGAGVLAGRGYVRFGRVTPLPLGLAFDGPVRAGETVRIEVTGATPGATVYVGSSLAGYGSVEVPALGIALGLAPPVTLAGSGPADAGGTLSLERPVPPNASGVVVFVQSAQSGNVSPVVVVEVE